MSSKDPVEKNITKKQQVDIKIDPSVTKEGKNVNRSPGLSDNLANLQQTIGNQAIGTIFRQNKQTNIEPNFSTSLKDVVLQQAIGNHLSRSQTPVREVTSQTNTVQRMGVGDNLPDMETAVKSRFKMLDRYHTDIETDKMNLKTLSEVLDDDKVKATVEGNVNAIFDTGDPIKINSIIKQMKIVLEVNHPSTLQQVKEHAIARSGGEKNAEMAFIYFIKETEKRTSQQTPPTANYAMDADKFLAEQKGVEIKEGIIPTNKTESLIAKLRTIPVVRTMTKEKKIEDVDTGWENGKKLHENIFDRESDNIAWKEFIDERETFTQSVKHADEIIRYLVEPSLLADIPIPQINVFPLKTKTKQNLGGLRPKSLKNEIHLPVDAIPQHIVHECGHYLEQHLPNEVWFSIRKLIEARHIQAGGEKKAVSYDPQINEGRYPGEYPATGPYTSVTYDEGSTEVMSVAMEHMSDPAKFEALIEKDPQLAALILRSIRPMDFEKFIGHDFDDYLPSKIK